MTTELECVCGQPMTQTAAGSLPTWNCPACGYTAVEYNIGSGAYGWHAPEAKTDNHNYEVRGWRSGQHMSYSVKCPVCGKRHMLQRRKRGRGLPDNYSLWNHDTVLMWSQSELDAMAAEK